MAVRQAGKPPRSAAGLITYLLEPKNWLVVTVIGIGGHLDGLAGVGWGLLAALFTAVLPTLFISYGIRRGRWDDRNVGARGPRLIVLTFIMASVAAGMILLIAMIGAIVLTLKHRVGVKRQDVGRQTARTPATGMRIVSIRSGEGIEE